MLFRKPEVVNEVVLHVTNPGGRENLCFFFDALFLLGLAFVDARFYEVGVLAGDALGGYVVVEGKAFAVGFVVVCGPNDVFASGVVEEQNLKKLGAVFVNCLLFDVDFVF